ncbi:GABA permease [Pochonia chlamydosporia 170]|uniref:GABA permease n=1 Tax=Pochonia chlamydosporia 170 TaxID=1380566 RepID=A0A179FAC7_METCM|nr:GABA permease [Pochonia chlamydosporia 170]OAQ62485.2 GABA permease [Pochonia chlamydosporia 170]
MRTLGLCPGSKDTIEMVSSLSSAKSTFGTPCGAGGKDRAVEMGQVVLEENDNFRHATRYTRADAEDMRRMGRDQELVRNFRMFSVASFAAINTAIWEYSIFQITPALTNGGNPSLLYSTIWNFIGFGPIYLSMAEMASMAPIAGSQYHWVSEFAPESWQKGLSYVSGWTSTLGLQAGNAMGNLLVGTLLQTVIAVNNPEYDSPLWQGTLLVLPALIMAFLGSVIGHRALPYWQNAAFAVHIIVYFTIIIPVWVNAPMATSSYVWTGFENSGGWPSMTLAILIGQLSGTTFQVGIDAATHMSEEVRNAARSVPRAMLSVYVANFIILFPMLVTLCYHIPDSSVALNDKTSYPTIYVLRQSMSQGWVTAVLLATIAILVSSNVTQLTATSRDLYAFSRDRGLPFSAWISQVDKRRNVPTNAAIVTSCISLSLSLIYIGSSVAFYAVTSLFTVALIQCYTLSIACILWRRMYYPNTLPYAQFSLGKYGILINLLGVIYGVWSFFWCFWPESSPVTAEGFNWASPLFVGTLLGALAHYGFIGRHRYSGPVALVEGRRES